MVGQERELVDVVDEDDRVVRTVTREEMRRHNLRHRAVYVVVRTSGREIVVHRRAEWKDVFPGAWDLCFGGVLGPGEAWDVAASRELAEEAGVDATPALLDEARWDDPPINARVYVVDSDGPFPCPDGEVVELARVPIDEVATWVDGRRCCPDSVGLVLPLLPRL